jgi:hypothetical protein
MAEKEMIIFGTDLNKILKEEALAIVPVKKEALALIPVKKEAMAITCGASRQKCKLRDLIWLSLAEYDIWLCYAASEVELRLA